MNKKFFFFKRTESAVEGSSYSNTGKSMSSFAVSADLLSYMTSSSGYVILYFNDATPYEENYLVEGQSFEKSRVKVFCSVGKEFELMEGVMNFIARPDNNRAVMTFDFMGNNTFASVSSDPSEVFVPSIPVSRGTFTPKNLASGTTIAGIDFNDTDNLPLVDYNETALGNPTTAISTWTNDGLATLTSSNYDLTQGTATDRPTVAAADDIVSTDYVELYNASAYQMNLETTDELVLKNDFVMYCTVVIPANTPAQPFYGNKLGSEDSIGIFPANGSNEFRVRFSDNESLKFSSSIKFPVATNESETSETSLYSFVLRKDVQGDIYIYDKNGDIVGTKNASLETEGSFKFKYLGGVLAASKMKIARFGVVGKDLGDEMCRYIGQAMYNHYKS